MKIYWAGTDALSLISYPSPFRFRRKCKAFAMRVAVKIMDSLFLSGHIVNHPLLKEHLIEFGIKKPIIVLELPLKHNKYYEKVTHKGFNVLYYKTPNTTDNFRAWVYGYDIYLEVKKRVNGVNWIEIDGSQDLSKIFPIVDFYLRCNRHDGVSRLRRECEIQQIPYYWSQQNPNVDEIVNTIEKYKLKKNEEKKDNH